MIALLGAGSLLAGIKVVGLYGLSLRALTLMAPLACCVFFAALVYLPSPGPKLRTRAVLALLPLVLSGIWMVLYFAFVL